MYSDPMGHSFAVYRNKKEYTACLMTLGLQLPITHLPHQWTEQYWLLTTFPFLFFLPKSICSVCGGRLSIFFLTIFFLFIFRPLFLPVHFPLFTPSHGRMTALCLTNFTDLRYIHSWLGLLTQLVNCCPHWRRNYTCVLLPLYLLSHLPPPFLN